MMRPTLPPSNNEGIEDRLATFETEPRTAADVELWLKSGRPVVVVLDENGTLTAFGNIGSYKPRPCYDGVGEFAVYVKRSARGQGVGKVALKALIDAAREAGYWKLVSRIFPENTASRALAKSLGFREVGIYEKHGKLDGVWKDCVIVEKLIEENID